MKPSLIIVILALALALAALFVFVPDAAQFVDGLFARLENVKLIEVSNNNLNFSLKADISLPKFDISLDTTGAPSFDISILIIIAAVIAIIISPLNEIISLITTVAFSIVGAYVSSQIIDVYKALRSSGVGTWQAANSCFWPMFFVFLVIISNGLLGIYGTYLKQLISKTTNAAAAGILFSVIIGAIMAFIVAGITYLLLGFGWAGAIILSLVISIIFAIFAELANLLGNS